MESKSSNKLPFLMVAVLIFAVVTAAVMYFNRDTTLPSVIAPSPSIVLKHPLIPPAVVKPATLAPTAPAAAKPAPKARVAVKSTPEKFEALWTAGGPTYQAVVGKLSEKYFAEMDKTSCQIRLHAFDFTDAIKAANVQSPGDEMLVKKQVATMGCGTQHEFNRAVRLVASLSL